MKLLLKPLKNQKGTTLIEILIAFTLLLLVVTPLFKALHVGEKLEKYSEEEIKALYIASTILQHKKASIKLQGEAKDTVPETVQQYDNFEYEVALRPVSIGDSTWELYEVTVRVWNESGQEVQLVSRVSRR
ncbi:prepilin-type N-terminal cleavage/methylation domain-containing protein [Heliorestis convoluta]|uniref:Prepilin-type N-terminal cleavage/methylation domain-containing protein n=1 Tax=Heliorestis convoluta TaxID=356322 RepID=A0A5Q2N401_9FIRM|nr:prepilin-type N-terminal cleavage/methylation domain-containing protein [Heliorestis convoluta]QGG49051.1 hypothetical protein FTV88_2966 [Heliorestis convoluta]